jgi:hypothetical protein
VSEPIPQDFALRLQAAAIGGDEPEWSYFEIRALDPAATQVFIPVRDLHGVKRCVEDLRERHQVYIGAAPRTREAGTADAVERVWTLLADCDTPDSVDRLRRFHLQPSIIVRSGGASHRVHAYWPLRKGIDPDLAERCNARLAYALDSDPAVKDRARIIRPILSINRKAGRPAVVECIRLELDVFEAGDVVRDLLDPPTFRIESSRHPDHQSPATPKTLAGLARFVREAPEGERNNRLNWAAYKGGEHLAAGDLSAADVEGELLAGALDVGLREAEALRTIRSGLDGARRSA